MDITPLIPKGYNVIQKYGTGSFTISGQRFEGSLILFPDAVFPSDVTSCDTIVETQLSTILERADELEVLLIGSGATIVSLPASIRSVLRVRAIAVDVMDTGAACRTYNVLLSEGRQVAALLIVYDDSK